MVRRVMLFRYGIYAYVRFSRSFLGERYRSVDEREQGMVLTHAYILTRVVGRTPLAYDNVARFCELTTEELHAESFAFRLATVLGATYSFLVCHL